MELLTELEKDALREVGYIGAGHAAKALSRMIGQTIDVRLLVATIMPLTGLPESVGDKETLVTGIHLPITGDVEGSVLVIFPQKSALLLVDLLLKRKPGTSKDLDEMDRSALKEAGNILAGNCLTALSHLLGIKLTEHVPDLAHGMVGALVDNVTVVFGRKAEQALIINLELNTRTATRILAYFFLLFTLGEARVILKAIRAKVGG